MIPKATPLKISAVDLLTLTVAIYSDGIKNDDDTTRTRMFAEVLRMLDLAQQAITLHDYVQTQQQASE